MFTVNSSASREYFSRLINLIGSIKKNTTYQIKFRVWDLGLSSFQKWILGLIDVECITLPNFSPHWRDCYSWKTYVLKHSPDQLFLHLDAGNTVLCDIHEIFGIIKKSGYFFVDQGQILSVVAPDDYIKHFGAEKYRDAMVIAAGNIGFDRKVQWLDTVMTQVYQSAIDGYCLGYSRSESWRNSNGKFPVRDCKAFRHDQTVLNCALRGSGENFVYNSHEIYSAIKPSSDVKIFNQRKRSYKYIIFSSKLYGPLFLLYSFFLDFKIIVNSRVVKYIASIKA